MSAADAATRLMTADEFMALPDDGKERWLVDGQVYTLEDSMSVRNRIHSAVASNVTCFLRIWLFEQPEPKGWLHSGDGGFRLRNDPDVLIGADVAYASADLVAATPPDQVNYDGPPALAVEILSPSDKHEDIVKKINLYRTAGSVVWVIDPDPRTVQVCYPDRTSKSLDVGDILVADPYLPGFRLDVARFFEY